MQMSHTTRSWLGSRTNAPSRPERLRAAALGRPSYGRNLRRGAASRPWVHPAFEALGPRVDAPGSTFDVFSEWSYGNGPGVFYAYLNGTSARAVSNNDYGSSAN
jgi:hypothetical protein